MTDSLRVLVTGGASGIGRATVRRLRACGHDVAVLDCDDDALSDLPNDVETHVCDVTDEDAVRDAVSLVAEDGIDVLLPCAAYYELGAVEDVPGELVETQFGVNVFGVLTVARAALPALRESGGRIVTVASVLGRVTLPYHGVYCATKHAVESLSDALRVELAPHGVDVVIVEPGPVRTGFNDRAKARLDRYGETPYADAYDRVRRNFDAGGVTPERVADTVVTAVETDDPKARYPVTWQARVLPVLRLLLPTWAFDRLVRAELERRGAFGTVRELLGW
ncbi:SDR family oxidoreductase [Halogeometricum limi]|uniref:Short-chain dehydrogenase n=1 Tax=Halogeometricum limi TaxID=555875 RepID=A0A1I6H9V4_9EURY|nr:SDR family oxidoreductase [Halogeometricum limi]SFR51158.1 Short-chain dehydrogenase [Halogeometricum limi]